MSHKEPSEAQKKALIELLNESWTPHSGQTEVGKILFDSPADMVYVECGRKFGKTEFATYCCWLFALLNPGAEVYFLGPLVKQAKELVWANSRMQTCCTYNYDFLEKVERILGGKIKVYYHEMRIALPNGSFIKVDGSDNVEAQRGLKPDFIAIDEYRDSKSNWLEAVRPNMAVKGGKILFITTPPHGPNHAYEMAQECKEGMQEGNPHYYYLNMPSHTNDRIPGHKEWLKREKERLFKLGRKNEWNREYMAEFIPEDENMLIPQLNRNCPRPLEEIDKLLGTDKSSYNLYITIDPGNTGQFAALFCLYDPVQAKVAVLDEVYEADAAKTSVTKVMPKILEKIDKIKARYGDIDINYFVNPKTKWFSRDLFELYQIAAAPLPKDANDPAYNVNIIKDLLASSSILISNNIQFLIKESELFQKRGDSGQMPASLQRGLINCLRYVIMACGYTIDKVPLPEKATEDDDLFKRLKNYKSPNEAVADLLAVEYGIVDWDDNPMFIEDIDF